MLLAHVAHAGLDTSVTMAQLAVLLGYKMKLIKFHKDVANINDCIRNKRAMAAAVEALEAMIKSLKKAA